MYHARASSTSRHIARGYHAEPLNDIDHSLNQYASALAGLPLSQIVRTYLITSVSSSSTLLDASTRLLQRLVSNKHGITSVESNPLLRAMLWESFYKQFCAGENAEQVAATCAQLRRQGYAGVILEYALEALEDTAGVEHEEVAVWRQGMLNSVELALPGDFVGLKWSGMGSAALRRLAAKEDPSPAMYDAMTAICEAAVRKNVALLPAAEETTTLQGYFQWTLMMQRLFNQSRSVVYSTYQAYLQQTPGTLSKHLALAQTEGFVLGIKLVRGAYLSSEPKRLLQPDIASTHAAYDAIASALIERTPNDVLQVAPGKDVFPAINVVLATHNADSVSKAKEARQRQAQRQQQLTPLCFAQLQGMADEVSCSLLSPQAKDAVVEKVFKCTTWGTMTQCLNYLLRRAAENKDAACRTNESRLAMRAELLRRARSSLWLA